MQMPKECLGGDTSHPSADSSQDMSEDRPEVSLPPTPQAQTGWGHALLGAGQGQRQGGGARGNRVVKSVERLFCS